MIKKRTLNEYRQTKDSVYKVTNGEDNSHPKYKSLDKPLLTQEDMSELIDLIRGTPNDWDLGQRIREYFIKKTLV